MNNYSSCIAAGIFAFTCTATIIGADQVRRRGPELVPVEVSLEIAGEAYQAKGNDALTGTITCQTFTPAIAEGGDE